MTDKDKSKLFTGALTMGVRPGDLTTPEGIEAFAVKMLLRGVEVAAECVENMELAGEAGADEWWLELRTLIAGSLRRINIVALTESPQVNED